MKETNMTAQLKPTYRRIAHDFYPTPPRATKALLSAEAFEGDIWEPACGHGAISKVLIEQGYRVHSTDLIDHGYGLSGCDFLESDVPLAKNIITNPPYGRGLADQFLRKALSHVRETGGTVAMLLNIASLCHPARTDKWRKTPPSRVYMIDDIVCWPHHLHQMPETSQHAKGNHRYCWAVWTPDFNGVTELGWLKSADFR